MTLVRDGGTIPATKRPADSDRRAQIVAAAERAFLRYGFHATTMQQVAEEAGMSAGNIYRYFPSKEAIVEGLCELDQSQRAEAFASVTQGGDLARTMVETVRSLLLNSPPRKARMVVEIWAEAGRNPRVAAIGAAMEAEVVGGIEAVLEGAKAAGHARADLDSRFAARVLFTLVAGLFKRQALEPNYETREGAAMAVGVLEALLAGHLRPAKEN